MWIVLMIAGAMAALVTALLAAPLPGGRNAVVAAAVPLLSLALYLFLGQPELRGQALSAEGEAKALARNYRLLGQKPFDTLTGEDPTDIWALTALAEISLKLGHKPEATQFYLRAIDFAEIKNDPHAVPLAEKLLKIQLEGTEGKPSRAAMRTVDRLKLLEPDNATANYYLRHYADPGPATFHK